MAVNNYPCKRVITMGSLDEYQPDSGSAWPVSPYAASKIASSAYGRMFQLLFNIPLVIAQPFMVFGPNQKDNTKLVPYTILSCLNGNTPFFSSGTRLADWVFIQDVVGGLKHIACHQGIEGCTIELGTGKLTSVRDVVLKIFKSLGIESTPNFGFISDRQYENIISADTGATHKLIGWKAHIDIDQGIKETVTWYKANLELNR
jgi:nucleoside-diphosphate-sugar epimerase